MIACYTPFPATTVESQSQCFFTYYMLRLNYLKTSMQNSLESGMPFPFHKNTITRHATNTFSDVACRCVASINMHATCHRP